MTTLKLGTRSLRYDRVGDGAPLVFQHGLGSGRHQAADLFGASSGVTVMSLDAPSHADSDNAPEFHSFDAIADAVTGMMDLEGIDSAVIGGISMGAGISINLALRHPAKVRGLVLVRPAWVGEPNPANLEIIARLGRWIVADGVEQARERLHADPEFAAMATDNPRSAASLEAVLDRPGAAGRGGVLVDMVQDAPFVSLDELRAVGVPAIVVATPADPLHPVSMAQAICEALPESELVMTPPRYLEPEAHAAAVRERVLRFVREIGAGG